MKHSVEEIELTAGTKGLLIDVADAEVVSIRLPFRAGFQFGDFAKYEIPHLIEHHIFSATKHYPKNNEIMAEIGRNGAGANASTSSSFITYIVQCASFEVERVLGLLHELINEATFPEALYATERENVRTELTRKLTDWGIKINMVSGQANFPELILGYGDRLAQLDTITHDEVIAHYHKTHSALNGTFLLSGAIHENRTVIEAGLNRIFSALPQGTRNELWQGMGRGQTSPLLLPEAIDAVYFDFDWFAPGISQAERAHARLLHALVTGGWGSRVFGKAREAGLTYHVSSSISSSDVASSFGFGGFCNRAKVEPLLELITREMTDLVRHEPSRKELDEARERVIGSVLLGRQTPGSVLSWYAGDYLEDGVIRPYDEFFDLARATTTKDIREIVEHFLSSTRHSIVLLGGIDGLKADSIQGILEPIWH